MPPKVFRDECFPDGSERCRGGINFCILQGWLYHWRSPQKSQNELGGWYRIRPVEEADYANARHRDPQPR